MADLAKSQNCQNLVNACMIIGTNLGQNYNYVHNVKKCTAHHILNSLISNSVSRKL